MAHGVDVADRIRDRPSALLLHVECSALRPHHGDDALDRFARELCRLAQYGEALAGAPHRLDVMTPIPKRPPLEPARDFARIGPNTRNAEIAATR